MQARGVASVLVVTGALLASSPAQAVTAKAGAPCKRAGATHTVAGVKLTCVKTGSRLLWKRTAVKPVLKPPAQQVVAGDLCSRRGDRHPLAAGLLECRDTAGQVLRWVEVTAKPADLSFAPSPAPMETCRVPDQRIARTQQFAIAYPVPTLFPNIPNLGTTKVAVIPVDFSDVPGRAAPSVIADSLVRETDAWFAWFTHGKVRQQWQVGARWLRAPQPSAYYNWVHPGLGRLGTAAVTPAQLTQELVDLADPTFDFTGVGVVFFIFPPEVQDIYDAATGFGQRIVTDEGTYPVGTYATGKWLYESKYSVSAWYIHELVHVYGYAAHSPAYPGVFGVFHNQGGAGQNVNAWDAMAFDWIDRQQVWCAALETLPPVELTLVPMEREQLGTTSAMVRLGPSRVLIVESHRRDAWGRGFPDGFAGVSMYVVDTRYDVDRSGENNGQDDGKGGRYTRYANYVPMTSLGHSSMQLPRQSDGVGYLQFELDLNYVMFPGENFVFEGVKVSLLRGGDNDTIRIERA